MRHEVRNLVVPAQGADGTAVDVKDLMHLAVLIDGTGANVFSVKVQGKISGPSGDSETLNDTWVDLTGAIAATTIVPLDRAATADLGGYSIPFTHVRLHSTTIGAVPPKALIAGRHTRTH